MRDFSYAARCCGWEPSCCGGKQQHIKLLQLFFDALSPCLGASCAQAMHSVHNFCIVVRIYKYSMSQSCSCAAAAVHEDEDEEYVTARATEYILINAASAY